MKKEKAKAALAALRIPGMILGGACLFAGVWWAYRSTHPITFKSGSSHVELGENWLAYEAIESVYGGTPDQVTYEGSVNTAVPGDYEVIYQFQNHSQPCTVQVSDTTPPDLEVRDVITGLKTEVDPETFVVSVSDASDVSLDILNPASLDPAHTDVLVEVAATDAYGNRSVRKARLRRVPDETPPEAECFQSERTFPAGSSYVPQDLQVTDDYDPQPSVDVHTEDLYMDIPGTYEVLYILRDGAGNETRLSETVHVE